MHLFFMQVKVRFSNSRFNFLGVFWKPISWPETGHAAAVQALCALRADPAAGEAERWDSIQKLN